jgi:uncharacterized circularly permuted ATP-grasp superfamily protein
MKTDASRIWELDPIPFVISESQWSGLSKGIEQRVRLLDLLIQDVYGDQKYLRQGLIPPELVFGSKSFVRPMQHAVPGERFTQLRLFATYPETGWYWPTEPKVQAAEDWLSKIDWRSPAFSRETFAI